MQTVEKMWKSCPTRPTFSGPRVPESPMGGHRIRLLRPGNILLGPVLVSAKVGNASLLTRDRLLFDGIGGNFPF